MSIRLESLVFPVEKYSARKRSVPSSAIEASTSRALTTYLDLPSEIHLEIIRHLCYPTTLSLRLVNRYFHALIAPDVLSRARAIYLHYLRGLPHSPLSATSAPCFICLRIRERSFFDTRHWELESGRMRNRMCINCRIKTVTYFRGESFWWRENLTRCGICGEIRPLARCTNKRGGICKQCDDWHLVRKWSRRLGLILSRPIGGILSVVQPRSSAYIGTALQTVFSVVLFVWTALTLAKKFQKWYWISYWAMTNVSRHHCFFLSWPEKLLNTY